MRFELIFLDFDKPDSSLLRTKMTGNIRYKLLLDDMWMDGFDNLYAEFFSEVYQRNCCHGASILFQNRYLILQRNKFAVNALQNSYRSRRTLDLGVRCFILVVQNAETLDFYSENSRVNIDNLLELDNDFIDQSAKEIFSGVRPFINTR